MMGLVRFAGLEKSGGGDFVGLDKVQLSFGEVQGSRRV